MKTMHLGNFVNGFSAHAQSVFTIEFRNHFPKCWSEYILLNNNSKNTKMYSFTHLTPHTLGSTSLHTNKKKLFAENCIKVSSYSKKKSTFKPEKINNKADRKFQFFPTFSESIRAEAMEKRKRPRSRIKVVRLRNRGKATEF